MDKSRMWRLSGRYGRWLTFRERGTLQTNRVAISIGIAASAGHRARANVAARELTLQLPFVLLESYQNVWKVIPKKKLLRVGLYQEQKYVLLFQNETRVYISHLLPCATGRGTLALTVSGAWRFCAFSWLGWSDSIFGYPPVRKSR